MIPPGRATALKPLGLDFDGFLYAQVGEDGQGAPLSVISALARAGVDPWEEAASLARLPVDAAVQALSALLARLPAGSGNPADPIPVASRLIALLPRGGQQEAPVPRAVVDTSTANGPDYRLAALALALFVLLFMATKLLVQQRSAIETEPPIAPAATSAGTVLTGALTAAR